MKFIIITVIATLIIATGCNTGTVKLDGYEHAVVICDSAIVVNNGHYEDPQVKELIKLAKIQCK